MSDSHSVSIEGVEVYHLDGKYYQKLGEVWDHEVKDFKILYKPLYDCASKLGSFEAHYLAVSTFERWNSKFQRVEDISTIPSPPINDFSVPPAAVALLSKGNTTFPLTTCAIPSPIVANRGQVHVPSCPSSMQATASGYGSRSHEPYYFLDFASDFKDAIISGAKTATTRVLKRSATGAEPTLIHLVDAARSRDVIVRATSEGTIFALLSVAKVEELFVRDITEELARKETFASVDEFISCLRRFYPLLQEDDRIYVFHFSILKSPNESF